MTLADVLLSGGVATYTTAALAAGAHPITAVCSGDDPLEILWRDLGGAHAGCAGGGNPRRHVLGRVHRFFGSVSHLQRQLAFWRDDRGQRDRELLRRWRKIGAGTLSGGNPDIAPVYDCSAGSWGRIQLPPLMRGITSNTAAASVAINQVVSLTVTADTVTAAPNLGVQGTAEALTDTAMAITQGAGTATGTW